MIADCINAIKSATNTFTGSAVLKHANKIEQRKYTLNESQTPEIDPLCKEDRARSNYVREWVHRTSLKNIQPTKSLRCKTPKHIVQFWDNTNRLPPDVKECMDSWKILERSGFEIRVLDEASAREFIRNHLGPRFEKAFTRCYHPSMKSDYFRYSYIYVNGGFYIDADDEYHENVIEHLFEDGRMKVQPFCYDIATNQMVPPHEFTIPSAEKSTWIYYFNTTPLIAAPNHPIIERALMNATISLEKESANELPEVQATTGPGNLTRSICEIALNECLQDELMAIVNDWEEISTSKWPLSYRNDKRNWRLSNQQAYLPQADTKE